MQAIHQKSKDKICLGIKVIIIKKRALFMQSPEKHILISINIPTNRVRI